MRISKVRASPVAQMVKNPSIIQETWVPSLGGGDSLEDGVSPHFSILAWRIPIDRGTWWATVRGRQESDTTEPLRTAHLRCNFMGDNLPTSFLPCLLP